MLFLLLVVVTALLVAYLCGTLTTRRGRVFSDEPRSWADGAALLLVLAQLAYLWGLLHTWGADGSDYHACSRDRFGSIEAPGYSPERPDLHSREVGYLPLRAVCHWSDGATDNVPGWINPTVFVCLAGSLLLAVRAVVGVVAAYRNPATRTSRRTSTER